MPSVYSNDHLFGNYKYEDTLIPITAMIGDQQSALYGHLCLDKGETKATYGTGCFILTNTKDELLILIRGLFQLLL